MPVAPGGSVVLASYVKVEKSAQEMLGGDINFISLSDICSFSV